MPYLAQKILRKPSTKNSFYAINFCCIFCCFTKQIVFRFISVPAKWICTSRQYVLNIYIGNNAYADVFQTDFEYRLQLMDMIQRIVSSRIVG